MDLEIILNNDNLESNYKYWLSKWQPLKEPSPELLSVLSHIPTTHTFGMEESYRRKPYKDILFNDKALLSKNYRVKEGHYQEGEKPKMHGHGHILSDFVFAFLGIHDHFFSMNKEKKIETPAFGVFLPQKLDNFNKTNATRTDLSSPVRPDPKDDGIEKEFFKPRDARNFCAYKIANEHNSNFNDYWGAIEKFQNKGKYKSANWKWQIEFHYHDKIESKYFDAILWPIQKIWSTSSTSFQVDPDMMSEIKQFQKNHPSTIVYLYEWSPRFPASYFSIASYIVTEYFCKSLSYINSTNFSIRFQTLKNNG